MKSALIGETLNRAKIRKYWPTWIGNRPGPTEWWFAPDCQISTQMLDSFPRYSLRMVKLCRLPRIIKLLYSAIAVVYYFHTEMSKTCVYHLARVRKLSDPGIPNLGQRVIFVTAPTPQNFAKIGLQICALPWQPTLKKLIFWGLFLFFG